MTSTLMNVVGIIGVGMMYVVMIASIYYLIVDTERNLERKYGPYTDSDVDKFLNKNSGLMDDLAKGPNGQRD